MKRAEESLKETKKVCELRINGQIDRVEKLIDEEVKKGNTKAIDYCKTYSEELTKYIESFGYKVKSVQTGMNEHSTEISWDIKD